MHTRQHTSEDADRLAHELQVHQAELESQNEELRRAQSALAAARDRYMDLYEYAPVGYLTLDENGCVQESNLTAAVMLGKERGALKGTYLSRYLLDPDADRWHLYLRQMVARTERQSIELAFSTSPSGGAWHGQIDSLRVVTPDGGLSLRVTLTDISERMQADLERRIAALDADAREAERRRVALELHENLGQRLSALKLDVVTLTRWLRAEDAAEWQTRAQPVLAALDDAVATVRRITTDLHPPMLDDLGLNAAIEWLAQDTARRLGLRHSLELDPDLPVLAEQTALALYRFAQESLTYLLRDTAATEFRIDLRRSQSALQLALRSLGKTPAQGALVQVDAAAANILQHRARMMGGQLQIDATRDPSGWLGLQLTLPASAAGA